MNEPRRLLTDTKTSELSRSLLAAGRARREPEGARERVWSAVAVGLAGGAATASAARAAAAGASAGASVKPVALSLAKMKLFVVGAVIVMAAGAAVVAMSRDAPVAAVRVAAVPAPAANDAKPESVPESVPEPKPEPEPRTEPPAQVRGNVAARRTAGAGGTGSTSPLVKGAPVVDEPAHPVAISKLREEAALLQEARAALGRGDTITARAKLADARARFPNTQLGEERDALEVRLASDSGDRAHAASLARAFVEHYPDSPLRAGVESIGRAPEKL
jgi:hypothetical protein